VTIVRGLQITMNDAGMVRGSESIADLNRDAEHSVRRHTACGDDVVKRPPLNVLHHDVIQVID
jgi:hypothetical protein